MTVMESTESTSRIEEGTRDTIEETVGTICRSTARSLYCLGGRPADTRGGHFHFSARNHQESHKYLP